MAAELRAEKNRNASRRHIACVTLPDKRTVTTNAGICEVFRDYFQDLFTREPGLSSAHFDAYLADFPCLGAAEAARLKANPVLRGIALPGATTSARYSAYADDISVLVSSRAEIDEVSKEYEMVTGAKISLLACGWVRGREFLFPDLSSGRMGRSSYSASGLVLISSWE
ncbi:unnamed protein product [Acanthosepion pharaonis]|uniref:Uncharacterized protein n=1 Tax=Acanthosepion pharaonis TaxID=158019 RepID=A0A812B5A8_ACAPH|nr:unnamed protein product [Sepia pharaonis]